MALTSLHLVDKSALAQRRHSHRARTVLDTLIQQGLLAMCEVTTMEILYSARNPDDYERQRDALLEQSWLPVTNEALRRAMQVQRLLARRGQHRLPIPDLMIAATAEVNGATVVHYDADFDRIAAVTGQPTQWIIPRGDGHGNSRENKSPA